MPTTIVADQVQGNGGGGKRERGGKVAEGVEEEKLTIVILANGDEDPIWFRGLTSLQGPGS
jgi:hypothetical protein